MIEFLNVDCMAYMATLPDKAFDLAVVDPPYGLNIAKTGSNGNSIFKAKDWDKEIPPPAYFKQLMRVSKNQVIWGGNYFGLPEHQCFIHWDKMNHHDNRADGELAWTSFDRPSLNFRYMWDGNKYGFEGKINGVGQPTIRIHPTEKPIALYNYVLQKFAKPGDRILDTHGGSMSSAIAAEHMGFDMTICELDKDYFDSGVKRFKEQTQQIQMFKP